MASISAEHAGTPPPPMSAVAVVTRTRDRPVLLARAAASVADQTFRDFVWVVVNDGGDVAAATAAIATTGLAADRIVLLTNKESQGMEAAANRGAEAVPSRFLVIHDDDDTWAPDFLARTVGLLDSAEGRLYGGVVTHADYVSEAIVDTRIVAHGRRPYDPSLQSIQLAEMLAHNLFPPISFVFRREVWERAGRFNERLPVLGDWYFNIRFLLEADIAVLPERLANWHHRDRGGVDGVYANSVVGGAGQHARYNAVVRNALVRDLADRPGAALAPVLGYLMADMRRESAGTRRSLGAQSIAPVALPGAGGPRAPDASQALAAVTDLADRRWIAAQLPLHVRLRLSGRRASPPRDPTWAELMPLLAGARLAAPDDFDEAAYRAAHGDVDRAIASGQVASSYQHYIRYGRLEGRARPLRLPDVP